MEIKLNISHLIKDYKNLYLFYILYSFEILTKKLLFYKKPKQIKNVFSFF